MLVLCLGVLIALLADASFCNALNELCTRCSNITSHGTLIGQHCNKTKDAFVVKRCCMQNKSIVIGLDWSGCNITVLNSYQFKSVDSLQWLDLSGNDIKDFSTSRRDRWFGALTKLELLLLPNGVYCDKKAWNSNKTFDTQQLCFDPLICTVLDEHSHNRSNNTICPPNSHCISDGPGLHQCTCNSGRHGYKCIQHTGSFPYALFFSASVGTTLAIIIIDRMMRWLIRYAWRNRRHDSGLQ